MGNGAKIEFARGKIKEIEESGISNLVTAVLIFGFGFTTTFMLITIIKSYNQSFIQDFFADFGFFAIIALFVTFIILSCSGFLFFGLIEIIYRKLKVLLSGEETKINYVFDHIKVKFDNEVREKFIALESLRKKDLKSSKTVFYILLVVYLSGLAFLGYKLLYKHSDYSMHYFLSWFVTGFFAVYYGNIYFDKSHSESCEKVFDREILPEIIYSLYPEFSLEKDSEIIKSLFEVSGILKKPIEYSDIRFSYSGKIDDIFCNLSYLSVLRETAISHGNSREIRRNREKEFFEGLFFTTQLSSRPQHPVYIKPDDGSLDFFSEGISDMILPSSLKEDLSAERLKFENRKLNKLALLYGGDQTEANKVLSDKTQQNLLKVYERGAAGSDLYITVTPEGILIIALETAGFGVYKNFSFKSVQPLQLVAYELFMIKDIFNCFVN